MDFSKIINKKKDAASYMVKEITHIIKTFEKRSPGSEGEKQACEYIGQRQHQNEDQRTEAEKQDADERPRAALRGLRGRCRRGGLRRSCGRSRRNGFAADKLVERDAEERTQPEELFQLRNGAVSLPLGNGLA